METVLAIATLLGGVAAVWFFWDKRRVIAAWFKVRASDAVNPLSLSDDEFNFISANSEALLRGRYTPISSAEDMMCRSLTNSGVLIKRNDRYDLSRAGRLMLKEN